MELNGLQEEQEEIVGYESPMAPKVKRTSSTIGSLSSSLRVGLAKLWRASLRAKSSRRGVAGAPVDADDFTAARPEMAEVFKTLSLSPVPSTRRGLVNLGQSCWMAAVLQCLATVRPLVAYLRGEQRVVVCLWRLLTIAQRAQEARATTEDGRRRPTELRCGMRSPRHSWSSSRRTRHRQ